MGQRTFPRHHHTLPPKKLESRQAGRRRTPQPAIGSTQQKQFAPSLSLALVRCGAPFRTPISLDAVVGALEAHKTPSLLQRHGHFPSGHN